MGSRARGVRRGSPRPRAHRQQRHAPRRTHPRGADHRSRVASGDERLRRPSHDRGLGDRAPRPRSGPLRRAAAMDAPWAVGDGSEPRPHVHAPRRLRTGVQPLRRRVPADRGTPATPLARRAGSRRPAARRARGGVARARRQLRGGRRRAPPRITAGARARLRSRAPSRGLDDARRPGPRAGRPRRRASDDPPRPGRRRGWRAATHLTPRRRASCSATSPRFPRACTTRGARPDSCSAP